MNALLSAFYRPCPGSRPIRASPRCSTNHSGLSLSLESDVECADVEPCNSILLNKSSRPFLRKLDSALLSFIRNSC